MISSVRALGDHSAHLKNPEYNATQLLLTLHRASRHALSKIAHPGPIGYFHECLARVVAPARLSFAVAHLRPSSDDL